MKKKRCIIIILLAVLLLPLLLAALLQTPFGKRQLAAMLERRLSAADNLDVRISGIHGWLPARVEVERIEIADDDGVWLTAEGLNGRWMISELIHRRIRLAGIGADTIELHRFPGMGVAVEARDSEPRAFRPIEITLDALSIDCLRLGRGVAGLPLEYSVSSGGIRLQPSGRLTGSLAVSGDAEGTVQLDAMLGSAEENSLRILAELDRMVRPTFGLDRLSGNTQVTLDRSGVEGMASVSVTKDDLEGELSTDFTYAQRKLSVPAFRLQAAEYSAGGDIQIDFSDETVEVLLNAAMQDQNARTGSLHAAATYASGNGEWRVDLHPLEIGFMEQVRSSFTGTVSPGRLDLKGNLEPFELKRLPIGVLSYFKGTAGGSLTLTGTMAEPELRAGFDVLRFSSTLEMIEELPELEFHISGSLADGTLQASSVVSNAITGRIAAAFRMPLACSLDPLVFRPDTSGVQAGLEVDMVLGILNRLSVLKDQRMAGKLDIDLQYDRELSGHVRIEEGMYEHFAWGLVVRDLDLDLAAGGGELRVVSATATDGGNGRIQLTGGMKPGQLDFVLALDRAGILRRDDLEGSFSGRLEIGGTLARPSVTGRLAVDRADILIDNITPALPPVLTDFDRSVQTDTVKEVKAGKALPFDIDIAVDLSDQVFANASMIDSVWGGNLRARTTPEGIRMSGFIEPRRGHVSFIGKRFNFTEGRIVMDGILPLMPTMNRLTSEYTRRDFTARLILNGRLDSPDYQLESSPPMPEDEVLSQVLFNRDTSSITVYQAFQIASAARQLSGGLSGPGFMYQMRQAVGVDTLEWREGEREGDTSTVAAGKYLTSDLYVEVNRSFGERGETGMMAEYDLTRYLSIETSTGPQLRPGIGVNVRYTY